MNKTAPFKRPTTIFKPSRHPLDETTQQVCGWSSRQLKGATTIYAPIKEFVQGLIDVDKLKVAWMLPVREILSILIFQFNNKPQSSTGVHCSNVKREKDGNYYVMYACSYVEWSDRTGLQRGTLGKIFKSLEDLQVIHTKSCKSHLNQHRGKTVLHIRPDREVLNYLLERIHNPVFHSPPVDHHPAFIGEPETHAQRLQRTADKASERNEKSKWEEIWKKVKGLDQAGRDAFESACNKAHEVIMKIRASNDAYFAYLTSSKIIKKGVKHVPTTDEAITHLVQGYLKGQSIPEVNDIHRELMKNEAAKST